jgi:hypothetical protein
MNGTKVLFMNVRHHSECSSRLGRQYLLRRNTLFPEVSVLACLKVSTAKHEKKIPLAIDTFSTDHFTTTLFSLRFQYFPA